MNSIIYEYKGKIEVLCRIHNVKHLYAFGSVLTENFGQKSDLDFLIDFENVDLLQYFDNYMDLKEKLEDLLKRNVDLVEEKAIKNPIFKQVVDRNKQLIYDRK
jgi:uncharacterized protein